MLKYSCNKIVFPPRGLPADFKQSQSLIEALRYGDKCIRFRSSVDVRANIKQLNYTPE